MGNAARFAPPLLGAAAVFKHLLAFALCFAHFSVFFANVFFPQSCVIDNSVLFKFGHTVRAVQNKLLGH